MCVCACVCVCVCMCVCACTACCVPITAPRYFWLLYARKAAKRRQSAVRISVVAAHMLSSGLQGGAMLPVGIATLCYLCRSDVCNTIQIGLARFFVPYNPDGSQLKLLYTCWVQESSGASSAHGAQPASKSSASAASPARLILVLNGAEIEVQPVLRVLLRYTCCIKCRHRSLCRCAITLAAHSTVFRMRCCWQLPNQATQPCGAEGRVAGAGHISSTQQVGVSLSLGRQANPFGIGRILGGDSRRRRVAARSKGQHTLRDAAGRSPAVLRKRPYSSTRGLADWCARVFRIFFRFESPARSMRQCWTCRRMCQSSSLASLSALAPSGSAGPRVRRKVLLWCALRTECCTCKWWSMP